MCAPGRAARAGRRESACSWGSPGRREERLERMTGAGLGLGILQQPLGVMVSECDAVQVLRELVGIGVFPEVAFLAALLKRGGDHGQPITLELLQAGTNGARAVNQLGGRRHTEAAPRHGA